MSSARVAKLEQLLDKLRQRRRPGVPAAPIITRPSARPGRPMAEAPVLAAVTPVPRAPTPTPQTPMQGLVITGPPPPDMDLDLPDTAEVRPLVRGPRPTPMEQALETFDQPEDEMGDDDEAEVTIDVDDVGPEITMDADEPQAPTAPMNMRAPMHEAAVVSARPIDPAPAPRPMELVRPAEALPRSEPAPIAPEPMTLPRATTQAKVARVIPAKPATFGELFARTLALRPRSGA